MAVEDGLITCKVLYAGICGSDINKIKNGSVKKEEIECLGHEIVCVLPDDGKYVINPFYCKEQCADCMADSYLYCDKALRIGSGGNPSGYSGYVKVPQKALFKIGNVKYEKVGVLVDGAAVVMHGIHILGDAVLKKAAVIGSGSIGLLSAMMIRDFYGLDFVDLIVKDDIKVQYIADNFGDYVNAIKYESIQKEEYDFVVEAVGGSQTDTLTQAINIVKKSGTIMVLGAFDNAVRELDGIRSLFYKQIHLFGVNSFCGKYDDFGKAMDWVFENEDILRKILTDAYQIKREYLDIEAMFEGVMRKKIIKGCFEYA